ncbi:hypothetical protein ElyMa_002173700 [Elysia marginata]|uniref:Uncharacterized protein n=1 Tax=Elysia marginata TaxID=1093978 RepID=A0AAV4FNH9_9GAST|nr:hypothetical protein ElyMa_002173700 [Elysia marginata]
MVNKSDKYAPRLVLRFGGNPKRTTDNRTCPDILSGMAHGKWKNRTLSIQEQKDIDGYLLEERIAFHIPTSFERLDGKCGNLSYEHAPLYRHMWFKAICDAKGPTPCCKENRCVWASEQDCRCPDCYDERQAVHAEYARWQTSDKRCAVNNFSAEEACSVLRGANLEFVGDSFIRHMFAATVILLSGGKEFAALVQPLPLEIQSICRGMHQFTALQCRDYLNETHSLCNNTVQLRYTQAFPASDFLFVPEIMRRAFKSPKSLLVMGLGIHDDFKFDTVRKGFLLPVLNLRQFMACSPSKNKSSNGIYLDLGSVRTNFTTRNNTLDYLIQRNFKDKSFPWENLRALAKAKFLDKAFFTAESSIGNLHESQHNKSYNPSSESADAWTKGQKPIVFHQLPDRKLPVQHTSPNILWIGTHAPGLLKAPKFKRQTAKGVSDYNFKVRKLLDKWKIPFMDTFSFTDGAVSYDGTHYGWGVNMLKANMLVQYVKEDLMNSKSWR